MHRASAVAFESPPQTGHLLLKVRKKQNSALKVSFASFLRAWRYTTPCRTRSIVQISPTTRKAGVVETAGQTPFIRQLRYWRGRQSYENAWAQMKGSGTISTGSYRGEVRANIRNRGRLRRPCHRRMLGRTRSSRSLH